MGYCLSRKEKTKTAEAGSKQLRTADFQRPDKEGPIVRKSKARFKPTSLDRKSRLTSGSMARSDPEAQINQTSIDRKSRLTSVSMASADPEAFEWERDSLGGMPNFHKKSLQRPSNGLPLQADGACGTIEEYSITRSSTLPCRIPKMISAASVSIGSPDPEVIDISEWNFKQRGFSVGAYRESSMGKFYSAKDSITLTFGVMVCNSFHEYHLRRDELITPYEIHLEEYSKNWAKDASLICKMLESLESSKKYWHKVEHIGSTSVPDMVAKPIIDIMITLNEEDKFKEAIDEFLREQHEIERLPIKIGFTDKAPFSEDKWGFFQVPREEAKRVNISEVNIHIFHRNCTNALEKNLFRNYLKSSEGHALKMEYCAVKRTLMEELNGGLKVADYALRKNEIVSEILHRAYRWNFQNENAQVPILGKAQGKLKHSPSCPREINLNPINTTPWETKDEKSDEGKSNFKEQKRKSNVSRNVIKVR